MSPHVLIVDDESAMVRMVQRHLEGEGFLVTPLSTGPDAIAALGR
jgi:CheY-like chemotaxis protein